MKQEKKLGLWLLVFVALGSMIGAGIFNSPKDLIAVSNPMGTLLTWLIGGAGAVMLALVFVYLAGKKPHLKSGVYAYAREGFGNYMGFNAAWGYWSLGWLGNISYFALFFKTLNDFLGVHALSPLTSFLIGSSILWFFYFIIAAGVREGAILNFIVTIAKLIPIVLVIILGALLIDLDIFNVPNWQTQLAATGEATSVGMQIKDAMAIVLWCFIGVEAASVMSGRAKNQSTVRKATIISLLIVLTVYILITIIAMATVSADVLVASDTPLAVVLEQTAIGAAGSTIVKLGIMVSVMGASLSWIILSVETLYAAAREGVMPRRLAKVNKHGTPINALLLTQLATQLLLFSLLSPALNETYLMVITIGTTIALIPYLLSSVYALKISFNDKNEKWKHRIVALMGTLYSIYVIYAVGFKYLYLSLLFFAAGVFVYLISRREQKEKPKRWEWALMFFLIISAIVIALLLYFDIVQL